MTPQYHLIKCYDSKQLHTACCKQVENHDGAPKAGLRVTIATAMANTHTHTLRQLCPDHLSPDPNVSSRAGHKQLLSGPEGLVDQT